MLRYITRIYSFIILVLLLSACNDGVFINGIEIPENQYYAIEAENGSFSFALQRDGLLKIRIEHTPEESEYFRYFGIYGATIDENSPADLLDGITFENAGLFYTLGLDGNMLYFRSKYNCTGRSKHIVVCLEYETGEKIIEVDIKEGRQLQYLFDLCFIDIDLIPDVSKNEQRFTYVNKTQTTQYLDWMPFKDMYATVNITPKDYWAVGLNAPISVPMYIASADMWTLTDLKMDFALGVGEVRHSDILEAGMVVPIEIPAGKTIQIISTVYYSKALVSGEIRFFNPVIDSNFTTEYTTVTYYPTRYELVIE